MLKIITSTKVIGIFLFESMPLACPSKVRPAPAHLPRHLLFRIGISETQLISGAAEAVGWHVS
jgi:hypothetical protein